MFIAYADESGYVGRRRNPVQPVQVLAAVLVNAYNLHRTRGEFRDNLERLRQLGIPLEELKAEQIYRGRGAWAAVGEARHEIFGEHLRWVRERRHRLVISSIDNGRFFDRVDNGDPIATQLVVPYIAGVLHLALVIQRHNKRQKKNKGKTVLIFDEQREFEGVVEDMIGDPPAFTDGFYGFEDGDRLDQIIDTAYFVQSHYSYLIQVADTVAFVTRLHLQLNVYGFAEAYAGERDRVASWFNSIRESVVARAGVYPGRGGATAQFFEAVAPPNLPLWNWQ